MVCVDSFSTFVELSITHEIAQWSEYLNGKEFVKFIIVDINMLSPKVYFINSNTFSLHVDFANMMGIDILGENVKKGHIAYHPASVSNNGTLGTFAFNYSNAENQDFEIIQRSYELLAANMLFINNNLSYFITVNNEDEYIDDVDLFENSRVSVLFEADVYAEIDYWGLNQAEGFGYFHQVTLDEIPGSRDIVLYETIPNSLSRVGGIITSVIQTPLAHVNLRAIQDNIPNAFIRDPLSIDSIFNLLDHYIYFKVEQDKYTIREATLAEVNDWYESVRPESEQIPPLNLNYTSILPLDEITFSMFDGYGAKCANVSTMRTFGFPDGTIPDGFGIPFYFYREFMIYNHFFEEAEMIMSNPGFIDDRYTRNEMLKDFRNKIKDAVMPYWMLNELALMYETFPTGTSVRCRSSTNNEDLPGFSGAGLYDSKTQHPDEGHISKSIKQVYASLWNLRAFEEREFYRVNHFITSMGILCHPNYTDEKVNGVGVSIDPVYSTLNTFYLNSQMGEDLITNPDTTSLPEEILLDRVSVNEDDYFVIQRSSQVPQGTLLMEEQHLDQMRNYLSIIHDEFEQLYNATNNDTYAIDIEYKITSDNQLVIKQARPWVSYKPNEDLVGKEFDKFDLKIFPNPAQEFITVQCDDCSISELRITNILGIQVEKANLSNTNNLNTVMSIRDLSPGVYVIYGFSDKSNESYSNKFVKAE